MIWLDSTGVGQAGDRLVRHGGPLTPSALGPFLLRGPLLMENLSTGGNTTRFAEPDGPANNFGRGAQPFGPGGPMVQFGARQRQLTPFSRSPGSGHNSTPPEPVAAPAPSATAIKPACGSARIAQHSEKTGQALVYINLEGRRREANGRGLANACHEARRIAISIAKGRSCPEMAAVLAVDVYSHTRNARIDPTVSVPEMDCRGLQ